MKVYDEKTNIHYVGTKSPRTDSINTEYWSGRRNYQTSTFIYEASSNTGDFSRFRTGRGRKKIHVRLMPRAYKIAVLMNNGEKP